MKNSIKKVFKMSLKTENQVWFERAQHVMPGRQSNFRAAPKSKPLFLEKADGAHYRDVDGKEYIDYILGMGPGIFGHDNTAYTKAIKNQIDTLIYSSSGASQTPMEVEVAEKIVQHVPGAEMVRFATTGTEAVQLAIRLARAYTNRPYFLRFEGHYHGWMDSVFGGMVAHDFIDSPFAVPDEYDPYGSEGRSHLANQESYKIPWNDTKILEQFLEKYAENVAMVIMEPILCNAGCCPPRPGFLERVRELCDHYKIVLCFDEVITGFRTGLGGAQSIFGVTPDLSTFGKALAGGFPASVVAGKKEIMDLLRQNRVIGGGTFNGFPMSMAAAKATLIELEKDNGAYYRKIDRLQNKLMDGLKEISRKYNQKTIVQGPTGVFFFHFLDREVAYTIKELAGADEEKLDKFRAGLAEEGVLSAGGARWFISSALTDDDITATLESADQAMGRL